MVSIFESNKDLLQDLAESAAEHVGNVAKIISAGVGDVANVIADTDTKESPADRVGNSIKIITDIVGDVTREIGDFVSEGIEMREASKKAVADAPKPADLDGEVVAVEEDGPIS